MSKESFRITDEEIDDFIQQFRNKPLDLVNHSVEKKLDGALDSLTEFRDFGLRTFKEFYYGELSLRKIPKATNRSADEIVSIFTDIVSRLSDRIGQSHSRTELLLEMVGISRKLKNK